MKLREFLSGKWLEHERLFSIRKYLVLALFFALIYAMLQFGTDKIIVKTYKLQNEIENLRMEQIYYKSKVMKMSREPEILDKIYKNNLKIRTSKNPPVKIKTGKE